MLEHWLSYSLIDFIPIETEVYINLFTRANQQLWPGTLFIASLSLLTLIFAAKRLNRYSLLLLGVAWCFCAYQFHYQLLQELHWIGNYFALLFLAQGLLLMGTGVLMPQNKPPSQLQHRLGLAIIMITIGCFTLIPWISDHAWQSTEIFGIAPNPTGCITLGALLSINSKNWWLLVIPCIWCLLSAAINYGMGLYISSLLLISVCLITIISLKIKPKIAI